MSTPGQPSPQPAADDTAADTDAEQVQPGQQVGDDDQEAAVDAFTSEHEDDTPAETAGGAEQ